MSQPPLELKTKTFTVVLTDKDQLETLREDLELVLEIPKDEWTRVLDVAQRLIETRTTVDTLKVVDELAALVGGRTVEPLHRFSKCFLDVFAHESIRDTVPDLTEDMIKLKVAAEGKRLTLTDLLQQLRDTSADFRARRQVRITRSGVLPSLTGFGTTVELRGVFTHELEFGENPDDTGTDLQATEPIISVSLIVDSGTPDRFTFQSDPQMFRYLIDKLQFALAQSQMLETQLSANRVRNEK